MIHGTKEKARKNRSNWVDKTVCFQSNHSSDLSLSMRGDDKNLAFLGELSR